MGSSACKPAEGGLKAGPSPGGAWEPGKNDYAIELLPSECLTTMMIPPINSVTFFEGDAAAAAALIRERVGKVLKANPWLAGRLHKAGGSSPLLFVQASQPDLSRHVLEMSCPTLRPDVSPKVMEAEIQVVAVGTGNACLGKDEPLFRVGVLRQEPGHFAVVVSMNHVIGDGFTYYKLFGALGQPTAGNEDGVGLPGVPRAGGGRTGSKPVSAGPNGLDPHRKPEFEAAKTEALGAEKAGFTDTLGLRLGIVMGILRGRPMAWSTWKVDADCVAARKKEYASSSPGSAPVSTNDILTSWFLNRGAYDFGCMAVNFRDRITGPTQIHAGNYVGAINFWPEEFGTAAGIRRALLNPPHFNAGRTDVPGFLECLGLRYGCVTNWATMQTHIVLPGCKQVMHLPLMLAEVCEGFMVIFESTPGQLAVIMGEKRPPSAETGTSPLGARLC